MKRSLLLLLKIPITLFFCRTASHSRYYTTQLTHNTSYDDYPQINDNGYVVWCGDGEIYLYDGTRTTQLTSDDIFDFPPQINNNGYRVWSGWDGPDPDQAEIFLAVPCSDDDGDGYCRPESGDEYRLESRLYISSSPCTQTLTLKMP